MKDILERNVEKNLKNNEYPGRGIIIGLNSKGDKFIQVYWIMGRSENSRNRIFVLEENIVKTHPFDESKCKDPSLIIYNALRDFDKYFIVSNGDQTDTVYNEIQSNGSFESALLKRTFEPDAPNYTPRVSGIIVLQENPYYKLNILKAENNNPDIPVNGTWVYKNFIKGVGHCIHTYKENGSPIPPFEGEPYMVPLGNTIDEIADFYWNVLNSENKISLVVKSIEVKTRKIEYKIINKNK